MKIKTFEAKDGKKILIRTLTRNDLNRAKDFANYINSIIRERDFILWKKLVSLKEEKEFLKNRLKDIRRKKVFTLIAEHGNKIVGIADIKLKEGIQDHIGGLGISVLKEYRGKGIGFTLMETLIDLAKRNLHPKPKTIRLSVMETNKVAINLYKKVGFKKVAKIPEQFQRKGKLVDEIIMIKHL